MSRTAAKSAATAGATSPIPHPTARRRTLPAAVLPAALGAGLLFGALDSGYGNGAVCLAAALLLGWQLWLGLPSRRFWIAVAPAYALIAAATAWAALASVAGSADGGALTPDLAWHELIGLVGYALVLLLACMIGYRRPSIAGSLDWLLLFGTLDIAMGLLLYAHRTNPIFEFWELWRSDRFLGTVNNANVAGALCGVVATLALMRLLARHPVVFGELRVRPRTIAIPATMALILALTGLVMTASRSGVALTCLALAALAWATWRRRGGTRRRVLGGAALAGAILATVTASALADRLIDRFGRLDQGSLGRQAMWSHYAAVARQAPWFGYGLGSFPSVNMRYLNDMAQAGRLWMVNSPHNIGLHLWLTAGAPYLLLLLAAAVLIGRPIAAVLRHARGGGEGVAALLAAAIVFGSSLVDLALEMPAVAALFLALIGLVWGNSLRRPDGR